MAQARPKLLLIIAAVLVLFALASALLAAIRKPAIPPDPVPNGYEDFAKAGGLVPREVGDFRDLDDAALRALVTTNAEALRLLREGFTRRCSVPVRTAITNWQASSTDLMHLKRLAGLLAAQGKLAELEHRPADAARSYCDAIRLGNELSRNGFLIFRLVGIAVESIGAMPLGRLLPKLDPSQTQPIIEELQSIDRSRVTWAEVRRSERLFMHHGLRQVSPIAWPQALWQNWKVTRTTEVQHNKAVARVRLLAIELALRHYSSTHGKPPSTLEELVPTYLDPLPLDPFTGKPLIYRVQGANWLLYSVGADRADNGGTRLTRGATKGDVFWDSL